MLRYLLPLVLFGVLVGFLYKGLYLDPHEVPSPLIGKPAPAFMLPQLRDASLQLGRHDLLGKVTLLNVWASWCVACRDETALLDELAKSGIIDIYGLDYKDTRENALAWLDQFGNPYKVVGFDASGKVGIDFGVYGVPETYVIDRQGIIRYKLIGALTEDKLLNTILPLVKTLQP